MREIFEKTLWGRNSRVYPTPSLKNANCVQACAHRGLSLRVPSTRLKTNGDRAPVTLRRIDDLEIFKSGLKHTFSSKCEINNNYLRSQTPLNVKIVTDKRGWRNAVNHHHHHVPTNFQIYRQNSEKSIMGGGGGTPPPPPPPRVH